MMRKRVGHGADRFIVCNSYWLAVARCAGPVVPRAHQRVLQNWQLIGLSPMSFISWLTSGR